MTRLLGRLIMVPLGFVLGTLMALFMLFSLGSERVTHALRGRDADLDAWVVVARLVKDGYAIFSAATVVPALLVVIVGEVARIRSPLYYILGGGAALAAWPLLGRFGSLTQNPAQIEAIWQVFATAGFAGGLIYWLVAGRRA